MILLEFYDAIGEAAFCGRVNGPRLNAKPYINAKKAKTRTSRRAEYQAEVSITGRIKMAIHVAGISAAVGAEVSGVDLRTLDDADFQVIQDAFNQYHGLLFRHQSLDDADLVAFSARFGDLDHAPVMENGQTAVPGRPEIYLVSNIKDDSGKAIGSLGSGEAVWHTDMSYAENPPYASALFAIEVPASGGNTSLCSMAATYAALPADLKARIANLRIKHDGTYNSGGYLRQGVEATDNPREAVGTYHPMVLAHPVTGTPMLYLGRRRNAYIEGFEIADSEALLDEVWQYTALPENCYSHQWQVGDLLLWDNRATMHQRTPFDRNARRLMKRTQIKSVAAPSSAAAGS